MVLSYSDYADLLGQPEPETAEDRQARLEAQWRANIDRWEAESRQRQAAWEKRVDALWRVRDWRTGEILAYPETWEALEAIIADHGLSGLVVEPRNQKWIYERGEFIWYAWKRPLPMTKPSPWCESAFKIIHDAAEEPPTMRFA